MNEETLERLAVEELLKDAKRGKERYKSMGPSGWQKNLLPQANKQFLRRTLAGTLHSSARLGPPTSRKRKAHADKPVTDADKKISRPEPKKKSTDNLKKRDKITSKNNSDNFISKPAANTYNSTWKTKKSTNTD